MDLLELSDSIADIKDIYMGFSTNAIFRYGRVVSASDGKENRFTISTKAMCDDSEALDMHTRLSELESKIKKIKTELEQSYNIKDAAPRKRKKIGCDSCRRKREQR